MANKRSFVYIIWRFFSSMRLALILILLLTFLGIIGALIMQMPPEVADSAAMRAAWLQQIAVPRYGAWTPILYYPGLFTVFSSFWFVAAGSLLIANILVCSINRFKSLRAGGLTLPDRDSFYAAGPDTLEFSTAAGVHELGQRTQALLAGRRYRIRSANEHGRTRFAADKNAMFRWGTYLTHLSLILFIAGFLIGSSLGFRDKEFIVVEGNTAEVGHDTGLSLTLNSFTDEYWPEGLPRDYRSEVVILDNGIPAVNGIIRVNHPIRYNGIRFYQSFFGPAVIVRVSDGGGMLFEEGVALNMPVEMHNGGQFTVPGCGQSAAIIGAASIGEDPMMPRGSFALLVYDNASDRELYAGLLQAGESAEVGGLTYQIVKELQYSGFQVSYDPGNFLIWIASAFFLLGLISMLYLPYRRVWVLICGDGADKSRVQLKLSGARRAGLSGELDALKNAIANLSAKEK